MHKLKSAPALIVLNFGLLLAAGCDRANQSPTANAVKTAATPTRGVPAVDLVEDPLDVPYVPTPPDVVAKMLEMARVRESDVVYDLGSGDGRIVIAAAQQYKARGVGFDLSPRRIQESNENAQRAGVTDLVRFEMQDLFEVDLSGASVVTMYLLPEVNAKLRDKLQKELKPGARVVSHNYPIADWEPQKVEEMSISNVKHYVYSWVVGPRR